IIQRRNARIFSPFFAAGAAEAQLHVAYIVVILRFGISKPAKRAFNQIADTLGVPAENCLVVGDRLDTDGEGARNSGMKFVQVSDKRQKKESQAMNWKAFTQWAEKEFEL
ncbi:MAG: HAD-IA family hydrolase, partial [Treponema sp.]|nr:HAD-IA family hydrolase [Treponema sp.]